MSDPKFVEAKVTRSLRKVGMPSATVWSVSCLLHVLLLWGLSTLPVASGMGRGSEAGGLMIEGRFLSETLGEAGDGDADPADAGVTSHSPEFRLVSVAPSAAEMPEALVEQSLPEEPVESAEVVDPLRPNRQSRTKLRDSSTIEPDNRELRRRSQARNARETASGTGQAGRRPGHGHSSGGGGGEGVGTTFFDVPGRGTKFVYVIDRSDSMLHKRRLDAARSELLASLHELAESSFVQVVFYNDNIVSMASSERPSLLRNTPVQQRKIAQFAAGIQPDGGTDHLRALHAALQLAPDAIFLLTDADEPRLHAADLDKLLRANRRRVPIHAIELGIGPLLETENFLMRLARQNQGAYRYWNVEELSDDRENSDGP